LGANQPVTRFEIGDAPPKQENHKREVEPQLGAVEQKGGISGTN
jgi:hypothetical protein